MGGDDTALKPEDFLKAAAMGGYPFMGPLSIDADGDPCITLMQAADMEAAAAFLLKMLLDYEEYPATRSDDEIPF